MAVKPIERECVREQEFDPETILIIEDDHSLADALSVGLSRQGFRTFTASHGRLGIDLAREVRPDLILLDVGLPDASGIDVCKAIDDSPENCGTPIIILSGISQQDMVRQTRAAGCRFFLQKPYDPNALLVLVRQAIDESRQDDW